LAEKDSLGRLRYRDVSEEEAINRFNYNQSYYINYRDGDYQSLVSSDNNWTSGATPQSETTTNMYSQQAGAETSLISDRSRVYKGGSWRDRAYWLSPGTRRYLDEDQSRDDLGFRCAMIKVGASNY